MQWIGGLAGVFGLGFIYFIAAIPSGAALGLPLPLVALFAWLGYATGGLVIVLAGAPLQTALMRRFKIDPNAEKKSLLHRTWDRYGLWAMAFLAPVTIGPQASALLGLALGAPKWRLAAALAIGVLPYILLFSLLTALGVQLVKE